MAVSCGLVGLPNVGKSTLFNLLMRKEVVAAENFPFCTIEPSEGQSLVPDFRLARIASFVNTKSLVPTTLNVTDIAGLIRGASKGEGLGSAFLQNIRNVDAIIHVVRFFSVGDIVHVEGSTDPCRDCVVINNELILEDLTFLEKRELSFKKKRFSDDPSVALELDFIRCCKSVLEKGQPAREYDFDVKVHAFPSYQGLLTAKPMMYVCNVDLEALGDFESSPVAQSFREYVGHDALLTPICVLFEKDLACIEDEKEREAFLEDVGLAKEAFERLVCAAYNLLGQISFFTAGEKEVRAWTVAKGANAQSAAGKIHTDIARGFIIADVVSYEDFCRYEGWVGARKAGAVRQEGKDYIVQDGDIMFFKFNV